MDPFSEILNGVKMTGAVFFNAEFSAPWGVISPDSSRLAPIVAPGARHIVVYHLVVEGTGFVRMPDGTTLGFAPGDVIVLPHGDEHLLFSGRATEDPEVATAAIRRIVSRDLSLLQTGGGGEPTRIVCGFMAGDSHIARPVFSGLPSVIKVHIRGDRSGQWLESSIRQLVEEASVGSVGSDALLAKLSEALFVDALRRHVLSTPEEQLGWLAATRDPVVGKTLALIHRRVQDPWTIATLAREAGTSRTALVERFTRFLSEPPMSYLTRWRLQLAARALLVTPKGIGEISADVGYESEAAFNRAFKRQFGLPPARYRREQRQSSAEPSAAMATSAAG